MDAPLSTPMEMETESALEEDFKNSRDEEDHITLSDDGTEETINISLKPTEDDGSKEEIDTTSDSYLSAKDGETGSIVNFDVDLPLRDSTEEKFTDSIPLPSDVDYTGTHNAPEDKNAEDLGNEGSGDDAKKIIYFENRDAKLSSSPVIQYVLDAGLPWDTVIGCSDGKVGAHRLVLVSASPFIGDLFSTRDHRLGEVATLILPDVRVEVMKILLNFCYTGAMYYSKEYEAEVIDAMKLLIMAEFADLTLKTVTIKLPPPAPASVDESENSAPINIDPQEVLSSSTEPPRSRSGPASRQHENSDSSDSEGEESSSESEDDSTENQHRVNQFMPSAHVDEQERIDLANNIRHLMETSTSDLSINYIIPPKQQGSKTKMLTCSHCYATFKTLETLTRHLDSNHGIELESTQLNIKEYHTLLKCNSCSEPHKNISVANSCISKHSSTRCNLCLEIVRLKKFAEHVQSHALVQKNRKCIVKCRWCEAGIVLQEPLDNKAMSAHCFSSHYPCSRNNIVIDFGNEDDSKQIAEEKPDVEMPSSPIQVKAESSASVTENKLSFSTSTPSTDNVRKTHISDFFAITPKISANVTSSNSFSKPKVPAVLALLQKAASQSQKRKHRPDVALEAHVKTENLPRHENPNKRARLDPNPNGKRKQVAKRTGKPVGRQVDLNELRNGIPTLKATQRKSCKTKSVTIDVAKLAQNFVNIKYSKKFIVSLYEPEPENEPTNADSESLEVTKPQAETSESSDTAVTEVLEIPPKLEISPSNSDSDFNCSLQPFQIMM